MSSKKRILYKSQCPYCNEYNCYNSGFSVECVNPKCSFYNKKHYDFVMAELNKSSNKNNVSGSIKLTEPEQNTEEPEEDELDYYGYVSSWYPQTVIKKYP